jgi:hypothetical protein
MGPLIVALAIVTVLGLAIRQHRAEGKHPLSPAFGATFVVIFLLVPGLLGYEMHKSDWSIIRVTEHDGPVWWQIYLGLAFVLPAAYFWRKGLRALP